MIAKVPTLPKSAAVVPSAKLSSETAGPLVEEPQQTVTPIETPIVTPEVRQRNYNTVRNGFLDIDPEGRCNPGGRCREAFEELRSKCGDPATWTIEDMQRPEIHDLVIAYRTFGILHDNKALIPQEKAILEKLLDRQQAINSEKDDRTRADTSINNLKVAQKHAAAVATNQAQLNKIRKALSEGVNSEDHHIAPLTGGKIRSVWGEPGKDMSPELTAAVVKLYDYTLRRTDKGRAADIFPGEPVYGPSTPEEAATLLQKILQYLKEIMQIVKNEEIQQSTGEPMENGVTARATDSTLKTEERKEK